MQNSDYAVTRESKAVPESKLRKYFISLSILFATAVLSTACDAPENTAAAPIYILPGVILVKAGESFQSALNRAAAGDTIVLEDGATFRGPFVLPKKSGDKFVTIRSSSDRLPADETRLDPEKYGAHLPKLISATAEPVISTANGAHHYRFVGIEFGGTKDGAGNIIQIGTGSEVEAGELPHHIELDRVYIHATSPLGQRRGIAANGRHIKIANSYISNIVRAGDESQAIAAWATDGPIEIINNYLEAAAENILFGGASSILKLVPTDCIVERNTLNKPDEWRGKNWVVKNLFEIKNGRRIKVRNNLMTNNWTMGQDGTAILFSTRADNGPATIIEDIEFTDNIVRNSDNGINVYGAEGSGGHRLTIRNNIFDRIGNPDVDGSGRFMKSTAWDGLVIENNTIINTGNITSAYGGPVVGFVFRQNIVFENEYGFIGDSKSPGSSTLDRYFPNSFVTGNVIIGGKPDRYRSKNFYPSSVEEVGFIGLSSGDLSLRPDSLYSSLSQSGKQFGATISSSR